MTRRDPDRWLTGEPETDQLLSRVLASSASDEPTPARIEALVASVALSVSPAPSTASVAKSAGAAAKATLLHKLAAVLGACTLAGSAVWHTTASRRVHSPREVVPAQHDASTFAPAVAPTPEVPPPVPDTTPSLPVPSHGVRAARRAAPAREVAAELPQLEQELRMLAAMRAALPSDPCAALQLGARHLAEFSTPVLAPEREQLLQAARLLVSEAGACTP